MAGSLARTLLLATLAVEHLTAFHTVQAAVIAKRQFRDDGEIIAEDAGAGSTCSPIATGEMSIHYGNGTTLRSIINQIADIEDYPGNTTSGVGVAFMQPAGDAGDVDPSTLWTLTPLTASIDFESAFAISQIPNFAASSGSANSNSEETPYCLTQPATSSTTELHSGTSAENGTYVLPPLELQPCPGLETNLTVTTSQLFYFKCSSCQQEGSKDCKLSNYLYVNECVTVKSLSASASQEMVLLRLETCDSSSNGGSTQHRLLQAVSPQYDTWRQCIEFVQTVRCVSSSPQESACVASG